MPRLSVWMIRAVLLHLGVRFSLGALILANKGQPRSGLIWTLLPVHIECVLIGWTLQLAMGVAFWILPRFVHGAPRGDEWPVLLAFGLLHIGYLTSACMPPGLWLAARSKASQRPSLPGTPGLGLSPTACNRVPVGANLHHLTEVDRHGLT